MKLHNTKSIHLVVFFYLVWSCQLVTSQNGAFSEDKDCDDGNKIGCIVVQRQGTPWWPAARLICTCTACGSGTIRSNGDSNLQCSQCASGWTPNSDRTECVLKIIACDCDEIQTGPNTCGPNPGQDCNDGKGMKCILISNQPPIVQYTCENCDVGTTRKRGDANVKCSQCALGLISNLDKTECVWEPKFCECGKIQTGPNQCGPDPGQDCIDGKGMKCMLINGDSQSPITQYICEHCDDGTVRKNGDSNAECSQCASGLTSNSDKTECVWAPISCECGKIQTGPDQCDTDPGEDCVDGKGMRCIRINNQSPRTHYTCENCDVGAIRKRGDANVECSQCVSGWTSNSDKTECVWELIVCECGKIQTGPDQCGTDPGEDCVDGEGMRCFEIPYQDLRQDGQKQINYMCMGCGDRTVRKNGDSNLECSQCASGWTSNSDNTECVWEPIVCECGEIQTGPDQCATDPGEDCVDGEGMKCMLINDQSQIKHYTCGNCDDGTIRKRGDANVECSQCVSGWTSNSDKTECVWAPMFCGCGEIQTGPDQCGTDPGEDCIDGEGMKCMLINDQSPRRHYICENCDVGAIRKRGDANVECSQCASGWTSNSDKTECVWQLIVCGCGKIQTGPNQCDTDPGEDCIDGKGMQCFEIPNQEITQEDQKNKIYMCMDCYGRLVRRNGDAGIHCHECGPGTIANLDQTVCIECPRGTYSSSVSFCEPCPKDHSSPAGSAGYGSCIACDIGKSNPERDIESTCQVECGPGQIRVSDLECGFWVDPDEDCEDGKGLTMCSFHTHKSLPGWPNARELCICEQCQDGNTRLNGDANVECTACGPGRVSNSDHTSCSQCPRGTYDGDYICTACDTDHSSPVGNDNPDCVPCGIGNSNPEDDTDSPCILSCAIDEIRISELECRRCDNDLTASIDNCVTCENPYVFDVETGVCEECLPGDFYDEETNTCKNCNWDRGDNPELNYYENAMTSLQGTTASFNDCKCSAGFTRNTSVDRHPCMPCPVGEFKSVTGATVCIECDAGYTTLPTNILWPSNIYEMTARRPVSNSSSACVCKPGFYHNNVVCTPCHIGSYKSYSGNSGCNPCPEGTTSPLGSQLLEHCTCMQGHTQIEGLNGVKCTQCSVDTYKNIVGAHPCTSCPSKAESFIGATDIGECYCSAGYTNWNENGCDKCAQGTFKPLISNGECTICPSNTISDTGSVSESQCLCINGHSTLQDGMPCIQCEEGTYKDQHGALECTMCPHHMSSIAGSIQLSDCKCIEGYYEEGVTCASCPVGTTSPFGSTSIHKCVCLSGWTLKRGSCTPCPPNSHRLKIGDETQCISC